MKTRSAPAFFCPNLSLYFNITFYLEGYTETAINRRRAYLSGADTGSKLMTEAPRKDRAL